VAGKNNGPSPDRYIEGEDSTGEEAEKAIKVDRRQGFDEGHRFYLQ